MTTTKPRTLLAHICLAAVACVAVDSTVLGGNEAPPSPNRPWYPSQLREYEKQLAHRDIGDKENLTPIAIDPEKVYDLPELIDIAERTNPETRIAWERARQAAAAVTEAERECNGRVNCLLAGWAVWTCPAAAAVTEVSRTFHRVTRPGPRAGRSCRRGRSVA